jgi:tetratricopeptide (TPR) repeat protein
MLRQDSTMAKSAQQLVGRIAELGALDHALAELERGRSGALELVGEPGIGKTRLLAELGARADAQGQLVLSGSASELERELPFWVFVDALDEYVQGLEPRRLDSVDEDALAELAHVLPSLSARARGTVRRGRTSAIARIAPFASCWKLAATKPLVLLLDDLHWADSGSIELLGSLLRRPPTASVLIALALRPRQLPARLSGALERADRAGVLTRLELGPLTADEARELLSAEVSGAVYRDSGGNPFYLQQLARSPRGPAEELPVAGVALAGVEVPQAVAAALSEELSLLPDGTRRVLEGAAVAGDPFELELAAAAAELSEATSMAALDELLQRDLVRQTDVPRRFRFRHPLVRRAVYEAAPGGWRLGAHERSAEALADRGAPAVERAHHVERSARHGDLTAVGVLREAGETAASRAPANAAGLFAAALRLLPSATPAADRVELLSALAGAHSAAGQFHDAYSAMVESLELLPDDALALRVKLTAGCAGLENLIGRHQEAHTRLMSGLDSLPDTTSPEAAELMLELAVDGFYRMDYGSMRDWARRAHDAAKPLGERPLTASAAGMLSLAAVFDGAIADAEAARSEGTALVDSMTDDELAPCLDFAVDTLAASDLYLDRFEEAGTRAGRALEIAQRPDRGRCSRFSSGRESSGRGAAGWPTPPRSSRRPLRSRD